MNWSCRRSGVVTTSENDHTRLVTGMGLDGMNELGSRCDETAGAASDIEKVIHEGELETGRVKE